MQLLSGSFPSCKNSHFQNEAKCETFVRKMSFIRNVTKTGSGELENEKWEQNLT